MAIFHSFLRRAGDVWRVACDLARQVDLEKTMGKWRF